MKAQYYSLASADHGPWKDGLVFIGWSSGSGQWGLDFAEASPVSLLFRDFQPGDEGQGLGESSLFRVVRWTWAVPYPRYQRGRLGLSSEDHQNHFHEVHFRRNE